MAYQKRYNPDALPAHALPDEAAQAISRLEVKQKPTSNNPRPPVQSSNSAPTNQHTTHSIPGSYPQNIHPGPHQQQQYNQSQYRANSSPSSPPPSTGFGWGARNSSLASSLAAPPQGYPPRTPAPPDPDSGELYPIFRAANKSNTGSLSSYELGSALVNADVTPFDPQTIKSLMRMFSSAPPGQPQGLTITFTEFQNLWRFLAAWRELFERFDEDQSGRISLNEFSNALTAFGYRLSMPFIGVLYNAYGGHRGGDRRHSNGTHIGMSFDLFVQACISLKRMTDVFKGYDEDRDGYVTLSFEEFLTEILKLKD